MTLSMFKVKILDSHRVEYSQEKKTIFDVAMAYCGRNCVTNSCALNGNLNMTVVDGAFFVL